MNHAWRDFLRARLVRLPGGNSLLTLTRKWRERRRGVQGTPEEIFTMYYRRNHWATDESRSGCGSTLAYTENIRTHLPPLFTRLGIQRLLDAPCGDFNWFRLVRPQIQASYVGGDIVAELIERNQNEYADDRTRFIRLDIINDPLPAADLWLCRDVLFHFAERDVFLALDHFLRSDISFILTSSHPECLYNTGIPSGSFRLLNLRLPPYSLPEPREALDDWIEGTPPRLLCLWERSQIAQALHSNRAYRKAVARRP